jgi:Ca2+-binding EF-hand superfamily protein
MEELGKLIAVLGSMLPAEEVMIWMDKNGDGRISKEEFLDWMERPKHAN